MSHTCQRLTPSALAARLHAPRYGWNKSPEEDRTQRLQGPGCDKEEGTQRHERHVPIFSDGVFLLAQTSEDLNNASRLADVSQRLSPLW